MKILVPLMFLLALGSQAVAKEVDLRNQTDADGEYNIAFCARPSPDKSGLPGHMFVAYSRVTNTGERTFVAIGHTVEAGVGVTPAVWSYFGSPVNGLLKHEMYTAIEQKCLDTRVNQADFDKAFALTVSPLAALGISTGQDVVLEQYSLGEEHCMTFALSVANLLVSRGLVVPDRGAVETPMKYIQRLIDAN